MPSASMITVQVPGFKTNGSTKLFWGTFTNVGSELGAKTICLDCSEPAKTKVGVLIFKDADNKTLCFKVRLHIYHLLNKANSAGYPF